MHAHDTVPTWDVEMEGKTGHYCHVYVQADDAKQAESLVEEQFPELVGVSGNTVEMD